jgi:hypothetical protein
VQPKERCWAGVTTVGWVHLVCTACHWPIGVATRRRSALALVPIAARRRWALAPPKTASSFATSLSFFIVRLKYSVCFGRGQSAGQFESIEIGGARVSP